MLQLAEKVIGLVGGKSKLVHKPLPADDPRQRRPVIDVARDRLGWAPRTPLREGLVKTIAYFDALLGAGGAAPVALERATA